MKWIIYMPVHSSAFGPSRIHCGGRNAQIVTSYLSVFSKPDDCVYKYVCVCVCAQSCPILCDPMGCRLPGSSVNGIFQARILEWVAISFPRGSS